MVAVEARFSRCDSGVYCRPLVTLRSCRAAARTRSFLTRSKADEPTSGNSARNFSVARSLPALCAFR